MRFRTEDIMYPPIVKLSEAAQKYIGSSEFLNLGQGLPGHLPPAGALKALSDRITHPSVHRYTPDQGHLELREELSLYLYRNWKIRADPMNEIAITAGANQGFAGMIFTILNPDENVVMPSPYYFNAAMAIRLAGGNITEVPVAKGFQPEFEQIESAVDDKTKAIYLATPNNPTGAVYDENFMDAVLGLCIERELLLVSDETYASLVFDNASHYSPRSRNDAADHVIVLGSFSKSFGMSGWRVGYILGPDNFMREFMKVQDTVTICASTPGQILVYEILKRYLESIETEYERLRLLRDLAYLRIREIESLDVTRTAGTFYLFPKVANCSDSRALTLDILQSVKTLVLPGSIFGDAGEGYIRLSIGPLTPEAVDEAFDRLSRFFRNR
ncbi:MAG: pyridoxal phosphate-dependent aminotransferase [Candidatus Thorarchaeota archaeon]|nr:pyridoxal phosphate-dependent aminotransferase [Candidatus Thorarchaeota archaeon]